MVLFANFGVTASSVHIPGTRHRRGIVRSIRRLAVSRGRLAIRHMSRPISCSRCSLWHIFGSRHGAKSALTKLMAWGYGVAHRHFPFFFFLSQTRGAFIGTHVGHIRPLALSSCSQDRRGQRKWSGSCACHLASFLAVSASRSGIPRS